MNLLAQKKNTGSYQLQVEGQLATPCGRLTDEPVEAKIENFKRAAYFKIDVPGLKITTIQAAASSPNYQRVLERSVGCRSQTLQNPSPSDNRPSATFDANLNRPSRVVRLAVRMKTKAYHCFTQESVSGEIVLQQIRSSVQPHGERLWFCSAITAVGESETSPHECIIGPRPRYRTSQQSCSVIPRRSRRKDRSLIVVFWLLVASDVSILLKFVVLLVVHFLTHNTHSTVRLWLLAWYTPSKVEFPQARWDAGRGLMRLTIGHYPMRNERLGKAEAANYVTAVVSDRQMSFHAPDRQNDRGDRGDAYETRVMTETRRDVYPAHTRSTSIGLSASSVETVQIMMDTPGVYFGRGHPPHALTGQILNESHSMSRFRCHPSDPELLRKQHLSVIAAGTEHD
ncbi:uncharacterized protein EDB93DRAFT_1101726 [Suillus bovinus]|uniref:uncharacterized protein n=1 Tax=Suillus bovinus TaxID=48563 RepID=UPI001B8809F0|nr:uncharacterized protein EDB93DRAFT_1101726 [Suillus bovinus]KAG2155966.1 hypothetical protein EDB93DRAFT_1101726 [Suillus bovinus]